MSSPATFSSATTTNDNNIEACTHAAALAIDDAFEFLRGPFVSNDELPFRLFATDAALKAYKHDEGVAARQWIEHPAGPGYETETIHRLRPFGWMGQDGAGKITWWRRCADGMNTEEVPEDSDSLKEIEDAQHEMIQRFRRWFRHRRGMPIGKPQSRTTVAQTLRPVQQLDGCPINLFPENHVPMITERSDAKNVDAAHVLLTEWIPPTKQFLHVIRATQAEVNKLLDDEKIAFIRLLRQPAGSAAVEPTLEQRLRPYGISGTDKNGSFIYWKRVRKDTLTTTACSSDYVDSISGDTFEERFYRLYRHRRPEIYEGKIGTPMTEADSVALIDSEWAKQKADSSRSAK